MADILSLQERAKVRHHLGYPNVSAMASIQLGVPKPLQTMFLVESAMDKVLEEYIPTIRERIATLDSIECQLIDGQKYLAVNRMGELEIRKEHLAMLESEYKRWAFRLAEDLGVPVYPFATRFKGSGPGGAGNISVRG
jgi:hypothetical protein